MARKLGKGFAKIDCWAPTTQTMSCCGHRQAVGLGERGVTCQGCGTVHDRDVNAAKNILEAGRGLLAGVGSKTALRRQPALVTAESHGL